MVTGRDWPMRHALSLAWVSVLGFQSGSNIITRSAPVKLTPSPPTRVVSKNTNSDSSLWNTHTYTHTPFSGDFPGKHRVSPWFSYKGFWSKNNDKLLTVCPLVGWLGLNGTFSKGLARKWIVPILQLPGPARGLSSPLVISCSALTLWVGQQEGRLAH